jgi:hypothetical protein
MTVVSTIITRHYTAHASDSFLTKCHSDGTREVVESQQSKLVKVPAFRGVMSYWGLASHEDGWNTFQWLLDRAKRAGDYGSAAAFAEDCAATLTREFQRCKFANSRDSGLGIHFTAYEEINGYQIPELFLLSSWTDQSCQAVLPAYEFRVTRETYATLKGLKPPDGRSPEFGQPTYRLELHKALQDQPLMFLFNNGDPILFNPIANSILASFAEISRRGQLKDPTSFETHLSIARRPVETVSKLLADLAAPGTRLVGGKPHDLAVSPGGAYQSTTGD